MILPMVLERPAVTRSPWRARWTWNSVTVEYLPLAASVVSKYSRIVKYIEIYTLYHLGTLL